MSSNVCNAENLSQGQILRTFLYGPAARAGILQKVLDAGADAVVLDLEDAVAPRFKAEARDRIAALIAERGGSASSEIHVRVNRGDTGYNVADLEAVVRPGLDAVRLPKCENPSAVADVSSLLDRLENASRMPLKSVGLYPTVETAAGVLAAKELAGASARVVALVFGAADFLADIGAGPDNAHEATVHARSAVVLASRVSGVLPPVDGAYPHLRNFQGLREEAEWARSLGFFGKSVIHPSQIGPVNDVFTPAPDEVLRARLVVDSLHGEPGTAIVDGVFVDGAVLARARSVIRLSEQLGMRSKRHDGNADDLYP